MAVVETGRIVPKPRIAIVCHSHPSLTKGGAEVAAYSLFQGLIAVNVHAIFIFGCRLADRARASLSAPNEFAVFHDGNRYDHFYHLSAPPIEKQLVSILAHERIDVVSFHHFLNLGVNALRAARDLPGVKCFFTFHEFLAICHNHGQMVTNSAQLLCTQATNEACVRCFPDRTRAEFGMRKDLLLSLLSSFDGFASPSHFLADRMCKWGLPRGRIAVIENGLASVPQKLPRTHEKTHWTFGYFGQINPFKGVDVLMSAAEQLASDRDASRHIQIRIHGNFVGQAQPFIEKFNKVLQSCPLLSYSGPYDSRMVYELMRDCDYIIVPSKWWENSPVVIQEAYAVGAPVICTGIGGLAEKVSNGISGLHFRLGDPVDLARAIKLATEPDVAARCFREVPPVSSATEMANNYINLFLSAVSVRRDQG